MPDHDQNPKLPLADLPGFDPESSAEATEGQKGIALSYFERGWAVIDWPWGEKATEEKWGHKRYESTNKVSEVFGGGPKNIGVKMGSASGGLVDVDIDHAPLIRIARRFLPETGAIFGRTGKPRSHWLYYVEDVKSKLNFDVPTRETDEKGKPKMLHMMEIRSTNTQTIFPNSKHPSPGVYYAWDENGEPARQDADAVYRAVALTALVGAVAHYLPARSNGRHNFLLPVVGFLLKDDRLDAETVIKVLHAAGDLEGYADDAERRTWYDEVRRAVEGTAEKLSNGEPVQGGGELEQQAPGVPKVIAKWFGWKIGKEGKPPSKADILAEEGLKADLFHTPEGDAFATVEVNGHRETHKLRTKGFKRWLTYRYLKIQGKAATDSALQDALGTLESQALFEGEERKVFIRTAEHDGKVYLDLANRDWEVVEIGPEGWRVIPAAEASVRFKREDGMQPLPRPTEDGGSLDDLRGLLNVQDQESWILMLAWLVAALREKGPFPVLVAVGQQGSAKSTAMQILRMLVDPNTANIRSLPRSERDLVVAASRGKVLAYDNLSYLSGEMSDTLCRIATGGGFATRELFTDDGERIFWVKRPVCLNGITDVAARPDLLDRSVIVNFSPIEEYRLEEELWPEFEEVRSGILGALLDAVSSGLARVQEGGLEIDTSIRMADFGKWAVACEEGLGLQKGEFLKAYAGARAEATEQMLENDAVAQAIFRFMRVRQEWKGETDQLRRILDGAEREDVKRSRSWPKTAQAFTNKMKRLEPILREHGLTWERVNKSNKSRKKALRWRDGFGPTIEEVAAHWSGVGDEDEMLVDNYLDSEDKPDPNIGKLR